MDKKPGRPRKYESAAEKVDAFRQRLQSAGYLRKEVLVTQATWERVQALAQAQGVGVVDVASGLLEHGLHHFEACAEQRAEDRAVPALHSLATGQLRGARNTAFASVANVQSAGTLGKSTVLGAAATPGVSGNNPTPEHNPILNFFARRKEQL